MQEKSLHRGVESRTAPRTNLFLAATMHSGDTEQPVKVRDLSATGARVETARLPDVGTAVNLVRGRLRVEARVRWHAERFCGLSFTSPVSIQDWMANPMILERRRRNPWVEADREVLDSASDHSGAGSAGRVDEDLKRVSSLLETVGEALASDPDVAFRHRVKLHNLGLAAKTLAELAKTIQADAPEVPVSSGRKDQPES